MVELPPSNKAVDVPIVEDVDKVLDVVGSAPSKARVVKSASALR